MPQRVDEEHGLNAPDGVMPDTLLRLAAKQGQIWSDDGGIPEANFQPASLDLRLGKLAFPIQCSFLPHKTTVADRLKDVAIARPVDISSGAVLFAGQPYLIPLLERLQLPKGVHGRANPKSTTGRLDIFTRLVTDFGHLFDDVSDGYSGNLYLEVVPQTFSIVVRSGLALNQLRLVAGSGVICSDAELAEEHAKTRLWYPDPGLMTPADITIEEGVYLSVDLKGSDDGVVAFKARKNRAPIDLTKIAHYYFEEFWETVRPDPRLRLILDEDEFYILVSAERVRVAPWLSAEMVAYDPSSGELRTHYAGFFDPGFGYGRKGEVEGSRAVLEVRARDVPFMLEHGQRICRLEFQRMSRPPQRVYGARIGSSYQEQGLTLGKQFTQKQTAARPFDDRDWATG